MMNPTYPKLLAEVKRIGLPQSSQHGDTIEMLLGQVTSEAGELERRSNINYAIGYMEGMQLIAGVYDINAMIKAAPNASHKLFTLPMAYGPRLAMQIPRIIKALTDDEYTRQALAFIGKPEDGASNDQPCTTTLQWLHRQNQLVCIVSMRSWDLIKGLPYDLMMFHMATAAIAHCLGTQPGPVCVTAGSAHIYERDLERVAVESSHRRLSIHPGMPKTWKALQAIAQVSLDSDQWLPAVGMRHRVPWMFHESYRPELGPAEEQSADAVVSADET